MDYSFQNVVTPISMQLVDNKVYTSLFEKKKKKHQKLKCTTQMCMVY